MASAVGGLRTLVDPGRTGELVDEPTEEAFAEAIAGILDDPERARRYSAASVLRAGTYTWRRAASDLATLHQELSAGQLVEC